jgi:parallel beta-helix repeat protein
LISHKTVFYFLALIGILFTGFFGLGPVRGSDRGKSGNDLQNIPGIMEESRYGCGPLLYPGQTYYVSPSGQDRGDGRSWETAWRTVGFGVSRLKAGDTLLIGEGEYIEPEMQINVREAAHTTNGVTQLTQFGEPGRPIRIMAAQGHRVIIKGSRPIGPFEKTPDTEYTYQAVYHQKNLPYTVWESDTQIMLQWAGARLMVDELPGTYWVDQVAKKFYIRFTDSRGSDVHGVVIRYPRVGLGIQSSYILIKGIWFVNYGSALSIRSNQGKDKERISGGDHITVEDCVFFGNDMAGIHASGAKWCLFRNNYAERNGLRGSILTQGEDTTDNLIIGNTLYSSAPTKRSLNSNTHYAYTHYGGLGVRNHVINNHIDDSRSFNWYPACQQSVVEGNIMSGAFVSTGTRDIIKNELDRVVIRNNVILGYVHWNDELFIKEGPSTDLEAADKVFIGNFVAARDKKIKNDAHFSDPAYMDYRLQADSPLLGKGPNGTNRGAYPFQKDRIFYVGLKGNDQAEGTSVNKAWKTLLKAASELIAGDTLYLLPGNYKENLILRASGNREKPIAIRAFERQNVEVDSIEILGGHVVLEGLTVSKANKDGIKVKAPHIILKNCTVHGAKGSGISTTQAPNLEVSYCTIADNGKGLVLSDRSVNCIIRDSIIAYNGEVALSISDDSRLGYLASHNCYFGKGVSKGGVFKEIGSIIGAPLFVSPASGDYRLQWNSPATTLSALAKSSGSQPTILRSIDIKEIKVENVQSDSVVLLWKTPLDDTTGSVSYRMKGQMKWENINDPEQGTLHGVGIVGLNAGTTYEFRVNVSGRRGGANTSEVLTFLTITSQAMPTKYYLSPTGDDSADGKSPKTAWQSLRKASMMVSPGDTVLIAPGIYRYYPISPLKSGLQNRRITFKRSGEGTVLVDGGGVTAPLVNLKEINYITVDGLTFDGLSETLGSSGVFSIQKSNGIEIINCRAGNLKPLSFESGVFVGASECNGLVIKDNVSWGTSYHLWLRSVSDILIKNNIFVDANITAVVLEGKGRDISILNNIFYRPCIPKKNNSALDFRIADYQKVVSDYNLFFSPYPNHKIGLIQDEHFKVIALGDTLENWQNTSGQDFHSIQTDPLFINYEKGDFRFNPKSPAKKLWKNN